MFRSIRWNFLSWLFLVLVLGLGGFGGTLYYLVRRSTLNEVDAELEGAAEVLAAKVRRRPPSRGGGPGPGPRRYEAFQDAGQTSVRGSEGDPECEPEDDPESAAGDSRRERTPYDRPPPIPGRPSEHRGRDGRDSADSLALPEPFLERFESGFDQAFYFAVWRPDGSLLKETHLPEGVTCPAANAVEATRSIQDRGSFREIVLVDPRKAVVLVGQSVELQRAELRRLTGFLLGAGGAVLAIGLVGAWFIAKRTIRPIEVITATAESISGADLSRRIDLQSTESELGKLAGVLNTTFDRLEEAFERQARFTADASHELRTPVAVILTQTTMAQRKERSSAEYKEVIAACHTAAKRMKRLVDGLLTLARNDAGTFELQKTEVDLRQVVEECLDLLQPLAAERGVTLRRELDAASVDGDAERLVQVVMNLVTNAVHYNRPEGDVLASLKTEAGSVVLAVTDTGVGIAPEHVPHVFERFFRADAARSSRDGGTGLGLAITKAIVEAHGGTVSCESESGKGSAFTVRLPAAADRDGDDPALER
jgi:heavy metal sensor kinase